MKKFLLIALLTVAFPLASVAQETCKRHAEPKGGFSFCPPEGWTVTEYPNEEYKIVAGPTSDSFTPNIIVTETDLPQSMKEIVSFFTNQSSDEKAKTLGASSVGPATQSEFITAAKQAGIKLVFQSVRDGKRIRSTMYFFEGKGGHKLLITFTALEKQAELFEPVVDSSMKTWRLDPGPE